MRGLSLSYKESIDQVWQAAAVSGFFVVMRLNLILEEMIMEWNFLFFMNSVLLGVGLAMDAFSVSLANGMNEKNMKKSRMAYIGGSMIKESMQSEEEKEEVKRLSFAVLMMQGIATSIDALSVGFTTAGYDLVMAVVCSLIVAVVTFVICETGLCLGKTLGTKLSGKADVLGGVILIGIGIVSWGRGM